VPKSSIDSVIQSGLESSLEEGVTQDQIPPSLGVKIGATEPFHDFGTIADKSPDTFFNTVNWWQDSGIFNAMNAFSGANAVELVTFKDSVIEKGNPVALDNVEIEVINYTS